MAAFPSTLLQLTKYLVGLVALLAIAYVFRLIATTQLSPLKAIPGPPWAKYTRLWLVGTLTTGYAPDTLVKLNRKHGPIVRVGPYHLLTDDPESVRRMLAPRTTYTRGPWFDCFKIDPHVSNIASERDRKKHNELRSKLAPGMTGKGVTAWESAVSERVSDWTSYLARNWTSSLAGETKVLDIAKSIQFLGIDTMTHLCFGTPLGFVETDTDLYDYMKMFEEKISFNLYLSTLLELNTLRRGIANFPWLYNKLVPTANDGQGIGKLMGITKEFVEKRLRGDLPPQKDMLGSFIEHGVSSDVAEREFMTFILAGSDTTATAARATLLAIISNPGVVKKLQHEIDDGISCRLISSPVKESEAMHLPYLRACIFEGLRLLPPSAQLSERMTPPEGDTILGYKVPGGVYIGLNFTGIQRNRIYGADVDVYRPERWLTNNEERLREMRRTLDLVFGHGETKCLGYQLAFMILSKIFVELIRKFEISITNPSQPMISNCYGLYFQHEFNVRLTLRAEG